MRKKITIFFAMTLLTASFAIAEIKVGLKGSFAMGAGTSWGDEMDNTMSLTERTINSAGGSSKKPLALGGGASIFARYDFTKNVSIQGEFGFLINNGKQNKFILQGESLALNVNYNSLEIPILAIFTLPLNSAFINFEIGPNFSIPIGKAKLKVKTQGANMTALWNASSGGIYDAESKISHFNFGFAIGASIGGKVGSGIIIANLRFINDFTKLKDLDSDIDLMTRRALTISAGYQFTF